MHNPYAHMPAPAPSTPEEQRIADYESAIGPNTGYYLKRFQEFDAGESKAGWHWPAFFATSGWFIYRKMWAVGLVNLFWPLILIIVVGLVAAILRPESYAALAAFALLLILPYILLPIYANALYWRHVRKQIEDLPASVAGVPEQRRARLERNGGRRPQPGVTRKASSGGALGDSSVLASTGRPRQRRADRQVRDLGERGLGQHRHYVRRCSTHEHRRPTTGPATRCYERWRGGLGLRKRSVAGGCQSR
jgi:hypothetical protein